MVTIREVDVGRPKISTRETKSIEMMTTRMLKGDLVYRQLDAKSPGLDLTAVCSSGPLLVLLDFCMQFIKCYYAKMLLTAHPLG